MIGNELSDILVQDTWETIPEGLRDEFLAHRAASTNWRAYGRQDTDSGRWEPMRPVVLSEPAYRHLESVLARLLRLCVGACERRASTLGELREVLRFPHHLPLMDLNGPLVASELTWNARPDILIEQGRPRILEFNIGTRLGGGTVTPRLAEAFAELVPQAGLFPPPSAVTTRSDALVRALKGEVGPDKPRRLLFPAYWTIDETGTRQHHDKVKRLILADVQRVGFQVVRTDLADLRVDAAGRLLAADGPIDLVMIPWGSGETPHIVDGADGLAALGIADRAGTVTLLPRTESALVSSKAIMAWLHEDCDADLLDPADRDLVRTYVPRTVVLGLDGTSAALDRARQVATSERDRLVVKPAMGKSGNGVRFGSQTSEQDWLSVAVDAAEQAPLVLQQRLEPDCIAMPFLDRDSGKQVIAQVPYVVSPFMIDGVAADIGVRHMGPDAPAGDVVISVSRGARSNAVVLLADGTRVTGAEFR
jgi:hypothetical protein